MPATIDVKDAANTTVTVNTVDALVAITGATTDTPSTAVEDATARTGVSLWKGIKNYLKTLAGNSVQQTLGTGLDATGLAVTAAGTKVTAATIPTGGVGLLGWLSAIWYQLTQALIFASTGYVSQPTVTRPANTTAYTAGDVVGGAITFTTAGPSGGHLVITDADLRVDVSAVPSGMTTFRLHLYDVTPPSAIADNGVWDLPSGDRASYLGFIDLGSPVDVGSTLYVQAAAFSRKVKLNASTSLYGYLVTNGGFTPAGNSEVYAPRIAGVGV